MKTPTYIKNQSATPVLEVAGLSKKFKIPATGLGQKPKVVHAVSDVSFRLAAGTTLGIVGESGCGKSTTARLIMGLIEPDAGDVLIRGEVMGRSPKGLKRLRREVQMVFQDSSASLNPRLTIESSIMFGPVMHGVKQSEARAQTHHLLDRVGLDPTLYSGRYPHELSGGQRQRVNIARALVLDPNIIIFDEAVSALDKSIEAQVLNLLIDLKSEFDLSYIFISHDLNVVQYVSDDVLVMYLGEVIERGATSLIYEGAGHPYTSALIASMPSPDPENRTTAAPVSGDPPNPIDLPTGCRFHPRCADASEVCCRLKPQMMQGGAPRSIACHMADPESGHAKAGALGK